MLFVQAVVGEYGFCMYRMYVAHPSRCLIQAELHMSSNLELLVPYKSRGMFDLIYMYVSHARHKAPGGRGQE